MDSNLRAAKKYFRRVKRLLFCDASSREQIHNRAFMLMENFIEENPSADYAEFVKAFGKPEAFAAVILSVLDKHEVENAKRRAKRKKIVIMIVCGLLIISVLGYSVSRHMQAKEIVNGDFLIVEKDAAITTITND